MDVLSIIEVLSFIDILTALITGLILIIIEYNFFKKLFRSKKVTKAKKSKVKSKPKQLIKPKVITQLTQKITIKTSDDHQSQNINFKQSIINNVTIVLIFIIQCILVLGILWITKPS
jgi:hypothetical protein